MLPGSAVVTIFAAALRCGNRRAGQRLNDAAGGEDEGEYEQSQRELHDANPLHTGRGPVNRR